MTPEEHVRRLLRPLWNKVSNDFPMNKCCEKCKGTGWYQYDGFNGGTAHSTVCDACCTHDKGFWVLTEGFGDSAGKLCCLNGCGLTKENDGTGIVPPKIADYSQEKPEETTTGWEEALDEFYFSEDYDGSQLEIRDFIREIIAKERTQAKKEFADELRETITLLFKNRLPDSMTEEQRDEFHCEGSVLHWGEKLQTDILTLLPEQESHGIL